MHQMIGKLLKDSGWSNIFTQAQVLTSGRAQSVLDEHHIKHTRYAHQISLVSLYLLQQRSYTVYCSSVQGPPECPEMWIQRCRSDNPMFMFWATIMDLELLMCRFIVLSVTEISHSMYRCVMSCAAGSIRLRRTHEIQTIVVDDRCICPTCPWVWQSVCHAASAVSAESFDTAFAKLLWRLVKRLPPSENNSSEQHLSVLNL